MFKNKKKRKKEFISQYKKLENDFRNEFNKLFQEMNDESYMIGYLSIKKALENKKKEIIEDLDRNVAEVVAENPLKIIIPVPKRIAPHFCEYYFKSFYKENKLKLTTNELIDLYINFDELYEQTINKNKRIQEEEYGLNDLLNNCDSEEEMINLGELAAGLDSAADSELISLTTIKKLLDVQIYQLCTNHCMFKSIADERIDSIVEYIKYKKFEKGIVNTTFSTLKKNPSKFKEYILQMCDASYRYINLHKYFVDTKYSVDIILYHIAKHRSCVKTEDRNEIEKILLSLYFNSLFSGSEIELLEESLLKAKYEGLYEVFKSRYCRATIEKLTTNIETFYRNRYVLLQEFKDINTPRIIALL